MINTQMDNRVTKETLLNSLMSTFEVIKFSIVYDFTENRFDYIRNLGTDPKGLLWECCRYLFVSVKIRISTAQTRRGEL